MISGARQLETEVKLTISSLQYFRSRDWHTQVDSHLCHSSHRITKSHGWTQSGSQTRLLGTPSQSKERLQLSALVAAIAFLGEHGESCSKEQGGNAESWGQYQLFQLQRDRIRVSRAIANAQIVAHDRVPHQHERSTQLRLQGGGCARCGTERVSAWGTKGKEEAQNRDDGVESLLYAARRPVAAFQGCQHTMVTPQH